MKFKFLDKVKGYLGFCQFDSCWHKGSYTLDGKVIKKSGDEIPIVECSCCKEHGLETIRKFEEEKNNGRWNR